MKCYNCGCTLTEDDFCTSCGADVRLYRQIIYLSNRYYNEGLKKAQVRDLSGAVSSLRESLRCNSSNISARNLLGLVYFEMGETVNALSEWIISKSMLQEKNIARDFIEKIQKNAAQLSTIGQAIKKYNLALDYCHQDSLDLAVIQLKKVISLNPNLVAGYQLLGLLYIRNEEWNKAKKVLEKSLIIDSNNTRTLYYLKEVRDAIADKENSDPRKKKRREREQSNTYMSGNETIIQPVASPEKTAMSALINIVIGVFIGVAAMWFLIMPTAVKAERASMNEQILEVSEELTRKSADVEDLNKRIELLESEAQDKDGQLEEYTGGSGILADYSALMGCALSYIQDPEDALSAVSYLEMVASPSGNEVSPEFSSLYQYMSENVMVQAQEQYRGRGIEEYRTKKYEEAIADLERALELNSSDDEALYYLAMSYRGNGDTAKSEELFNRIISEFPNSEHVKEAQKYMSEGLGGNETETSEDRTSESTSSGRNNAAATAPAAPAAPAAPQQPAQAEQDAAAMQALLDSIAAQQAAAEAAARQAAAEAAARAAVQGVQQ